MGGTMTFGAIAALSVSVLILERKKISVSKTVLISLLSALSAGGRVLFAALPNVQPSSFIIILSGVCFGPEIGAMTGVITALASNLVLGQGPWTIWQMAAWGLMGLFSGIFRNSLSKYRTLAVVYGFGWGFLFGWIMNLWYFTSQGSFGFVVAASIASFPFDLAHGLANAILIAVVGSEFIKNLMRIGKKYGIGPFYEST